MENRWCNACGKAFLPRPQSPRQFYCTKAECQRERRRLWQQAKRRSDPDYLSNQTQAQKAWAERNPTYWRNYRDEHASYTDRNRLQQRNRYERNGRDAAARKALTSSRLPPSGLYKMQRVDIEGHKMDVWIVQLTALPECDEAARVTS